MNASDQISLFYSYTHADALLRDELDKHLSLLSQNGFIAPWYDRNISAGTEWDYQIDQHLNSAHIILLLISADFLTSTYIRSIEMKRALERHDAGEARVIPILLRPVDWQAAPFARLQALPQNGSPVTTWSDRDLAFTDIAIQLRKVVNELQANGVIKPPHGEAGLRHVPPHILQALSEFRRCQKKVSELKSVHHMLHEIEMPLEGLSATIQLFMQGENESFDYIEIAWRQAVLKIDDLVYFATEEMETLEDERLSIDRDVVRGRAPWVKELFILQRSLEAKIGERDMNGVKKLSSELLARCRNHLYYIDRRLLVALKELDLSSDLIVRGTEHGSTT